MNGRLLTVLGLLVLVACHHGGKGSATSASCTDVAAHVGKLLDPKDTKSDAAAKVHDIFTTRCTQDKWSTAALSCMAGTVSLHDGHHCKDRLNVDQRRALDAELDTADREARASRLPPACVTYKQRMEKVARCDKLPQAVRDALKQGFDAMMSTIASSSEEERAKLEDSCRMGADAINQVAKATCGWT